MPFVKGQSGNPAGRPPGARNKATLLFEAQLEARAEEIVGRLIKQALAGQMSALRMCVDRLLPRGRERPVPLELPTIRTAADVERAVAEITAAVGDGTVTPREGLDLMTLVERSLRLVQAARGMPQEQAAEDRPDASRNSESGQETVGYNEQPETRGHREHESGSRPLDEERDERTAEYNGGAPELPKDPVMSASRRPSQRTTGYNETSASGVASRNAPKPHPTPSADEQINEIQRAA